MVASCTPVSAVLAAYPRHMIFGITLLAIFRVIISKIRVSCQVAPRCFPRRCGRLRVSIQDSCT